MHFTQTNFKLEKRFSSISHSPFRCKISPPVTSLPLSLGIQAKANIGECTKNNISKVKLPYSAAIVYSSTPKRLLSTHRVTLHPQKTKPILFQRSFGYEHDREILFRGLPKENWKWGQEEIQQLLSNFAHHHELSKEELNQLQTNFKDKKVDDLYADEAVLRKQLGPKLGSLLFNEMSGASPWKHLSGWWKTLFADK